jgi:hypothetical protein
MVTYLLYILYLPVFQRNLLLPSSVLKMEAEGSSEIFINIYQTVWCHMPENSDQEEMKSSPA